MAERIPRVVHLVWLGSAVPARLERLRADIAAHDPDVEVRVWRDDDLTWLRNHTQLLSEPRMSAKADIARYELLLEHGGMYLDADMRVHRSLASVFAAADEHGLVVARQSRTVYANGFITAVPGHPVLAELVGGIPTTVERYARMSTPARTGPHFLTQTLLTHLRDGGSYHELPQHIVYPWAMDEDPLPTALLPTSVIMSHEWQDSNAAWSWDRVEEAPATIAVPTRASRTRRSGGSVRTRASATPRVHDLIARAERLRSGTRTDRDAAVGAGATATQAVIEGWTARIARRVLRGSATFLDLHPATAAPARAAAVVLDRPGRSIIVTEGSLPPESMAGLGDPSIRCSVHVLGSERARPGIATSHVSYGSPLWGVATSQASPPIGSWTEALEIDLSGLVDSLPRLDLVRASAALLTQSLASTLTRMTLDRRIARLLLVLDPLDVRGGITAATSLLADVTAQGARVTVAPWLVDGRGRTWREQLRVATRPFILDVTT